VKSVLQKHYGKIIFFIFSILILAAVRSLFLKGFIPTHDGEYTIIRCMEFYRMLLQGVFFPRWAPTVNSGYGMPIFIFYYPLTNYIGSFFHIFGWNFVESFKVSMAIGYITSSFFCFLWLRKLFRSSFAAIVGSVVGAFVPYWFVELFVRGSLPEIWAIAFLFCCLTAITYKKRTLSACALAGLILSHNILALIFTPFLIGYAVLVEKKIVPWLLLGIGVSAYFWIPALWERQFVVGLNTVNVRDHFASLYELLIPSWGTEFSATGSFGNKMSLQIGIIPLCSMVLLCILLFKNKKSPLKNLYIYMSALFFTVIFLVLPVSMIIWNIVPMLGYVQYPWRFLVCIIPISAFAGAYIISVLRNKWVGFVIIIFSVALSYGYTKPVVYEPRDDVYYQSRQNFTDGTVSMGNSFSTIWTGWKKTRPKEMIEVMNGKVIGGMDKQDFITKKFTVQSSESATIALPILYYPGWRVKSNGHTIPIRYESDGTIRFDVPEGIHEVHVWFGETPVRIISDCVSILSILALCFLYISSKRKTLHRME